VIRFEDARQFDCEYAEGRQDFGAEEGVFQLCGYVGVDEVELDKVGEDGKDGKGFKGGIVKEKGFKTCSSRLSDGVDVNEPAIRTYTGCKVAKVHLASQIRGKHPSQCRKLPRESRNDGPRHASVKM
jgi:hypothetical protein